MSKKQPNRDLTEKQTKYCHFRALGQKRIESAINAGYSPNCSSVTAAKLEKRNDIQDEISRLKGLNSIESGDKASLDEVKVFFTKGMRAGDRESARSADALKDLLLREKGNDKGDPKPLFMASLLQTDALEAIRKNKPDIKVMMGTYKPKSAQTEKPPEKPMDKGLEQ